MPYINLLIKPASSLCNMRCRYCFYADEAANRELPSMGVMTASTAETMIARALEAAGKGTWARVQKKLALLQKAGTDCNLLCVVTRRCAKSAVRCYHAMQKTGVRFLQFIPCLDPLGEARGGQPWSLTAQDYGTFLCALFDEWYRDWKTGHYTSVRLFDDYVHLAMGLPSGTCATSGSCGNYFVVEATAASIPAISTCWMSGSSAAWRTQVLPHCGMRR